MPKICFVHCGPHKTGSTSIQRSLEANAALLEKRGLVVPSLSSTVSACRSHKSLIKEVPQMAKGNLAKAPHWRLLAKVLRETTLTPIVSHEDLSLPLMRPAVVAALKAFLKDCGYQAEFVYLLRDQPAWINSTYVQETRRLKVTEDFATFARDAQTRARFDYGQLLAEVGGHPDAALRLLPFERAARDGLFESFLTTLGVEPGTRAETVAVPPQNPNAGAKVVHVGLLLAQEMVGRVFTASERFQLSRVLQRAGSIRHWQDEPYCGLDDAGALRVTEAFRTRNDVIAQKHWGKSWAEVFPPRRSWSRTVYDPATGSARERREVAAVLAELAPHVAAMPLAADPAASA